MKSTIKLFLLLFFLLIGVLLSSNLSMAAAIPVTDTARTSSIPALEIRYPDYRKLKSLRDSEDFRYSLDVQPSVSWWQRFWFKVGRFLDQVATNKAYNTFWKYVFYALAIAVGVYAFLQILRVDLVSLFGRQAKSVPLPYELHPENIHEINFGALIEEAEKQGDYRRAVRLHYLRILKSLSDKSLINWSPAKTNQSYVTEIQHPQIRQAFGQITQLFEFVWYGGSTLQEPDFNQIRTAFQGLNQTINLRP